ncbi:MAG: TolC family protein, partial [bacterium]|nr:TolC family protein [bacterium]
MRLLILLLAAATAVHPQTLTLSMKRAVEIAVEPEGSIRMQLALESTRQAESQKGQARAALLPQIESHVSRDTRTVNLRAFGVSFGVPGTPFQTPSSVGPFHVFDVRANGNQSLFNLSAIRRYQASKTGVAAARAEEESTRDLVASQVAKAYLAALRAQATLEAAQANVDLAGALLKLAENQKAAGTGTGIDVTRAL